MAKKSGSLPDPQQGGGSTFGSGGKPRQPPQPIGGEGGLQHGMAGGQRGTSFMGTNMNGAPETGSLGMPNDGVSGQGNAPVDGGTNFIGTSMNGGPETGSVGSVYNGASQQGNNPMDHIRNFIGSGQGQELMKQFQGRMQMPGRPGPGAAPPPQAGPRLDYAKATAPYQGAINEAAKSTTADPQMDRFQSLMKEDPMAAYAMSQSDPWLQKNQMGVIGKAFGGDQSKFSEWAQQGQYGGQQSVANDPAKWAKALKMYKGA